MKRILNREGAEPWVSGFFVKTIVYAVLLFSSETWVVTPCIGRELGGVPGTGGATADGVAPVAGNLTGSGSTTRRQRQGRRQGSRQWRNKFSSNRTRLHST